jgi:lipoprotein-anchoring transpeptidase ErfK/SrfK
MRSPASFTALALLALLAFAPGARAASSQPTTVPAAGYLEVARVVVRAQPDAQARRVATLTQVDVHFHTTVILALDVETNEAGDAAWYKVSVPGRPNGRTGWIPAATVSLEPVFREIVIHRGARTLELKDHGRTIFRTRVAVGRPGMETPLGTFFIIWGFQPPNPFLGSWAFATSAYSRLSDWPGGGIVGIHGTSAPQYIGQAVSHGCVRLYNSAILMLKRNVRPGTPIHIVR